MAYSDKYPNGYKSGYSSADDPDRTTYEREGIPKKSAIRDNSVSEYWAKKDAEQREREAKTISELDERLKENKKIEDKENRRILLNLMTANARSKHYNQSFFKRSIDTLKGKRSRKAINEEFNKNKNYINSLDPRTVETLIEEEQRKYDEYRSR